MPERGPSAPVVAVIPARGGSKRIPRKNVRPFRGVPLVARTIAGALGAGVFDRVVVSTDDDEIADIAISSGAEVPFRRPAELADDHTGTGPVMRHAIGALEDGGAVLGPVCLLYPGAVFVTSDDLRDALVTLREGPASYVMSATSYPAPVMRALRLLEDGTAEMVWPEHLRTRSQDLEELFHDAGQFYWGWRDAWMAGLAVAASRPLAHVLARWRVQDIDTPEDWERAELIHRIIDAG